MKKNKLIIVRGVPGTGKSTYAKSLNIVHFEADMYFQRGGNYEWDRRGLGSAHNWCLTEVASCLEAGMDVVVSNTFSTMKEMMPYLKLGYPVEVVELTEVFGNIHDVPDQIIDMMHARWEEYKPLEADDFVVDDIESCEVIDRKNLSVIAPILTLSPIEGKDRIEFATVLGYTGVVEKGLHKVGDLVLVTKYDSIVPEIPMFEFMRPFKFRVKTKKFSSEAGPVYSQVIIIPNSTLLVECSDIVKDFCTEGADWTDYIGTKKYIPAQPKNTGSQFGNMMAKGSFPGEVISKTDEMNAQSKPKLLEELAGLPYRITLKCDGSSMTTVIRNDEFTVCSRNNMLKEIEGNKFWLMARKYNIEEILKANPNYGLQMELVGPGIQQNKMCLQETEIRVFNMIDLAERKRVHDDMLIDFCMANGLPLADEISRGESFNLTLAELLAIATRLYPGTDKQAEGIVVRPLSPVFSKTLGEGLSFKVINPEF